MAKKAAFPREGCLFFRTHMNLRRPKEGQDDVPIPWNVNPTLPRRIHGQTGYDQFAAPTRQIKL